MAMRVEDLSWKDIITRSVKTFVQAFLGLLTVDVFMSKTGLSVDVVASATIAAAYSVLWNAGMEWARGPAE